MSQRKFKNPDIKGPFNVSGQLTPTEDKMWRPTPEDAERLRLPNVNWNTMIVPEDDEGLLADIMRVVLPDTERPVEVATPQEYNARMMDIAAGNERPSFLNNLSSVEPENATGGPGIDHSPGEYEDIYRRLLAQDPQEHLISSDVTFLADALRDLPRLTLRRSGAGANASVHGKAGTGGDTYTASGSGGSTGARGRFYAGANTRFNAGARSNARFWTDAGADAPSGGVGTGARTRFNASARSNADARFWADAGADAPSSGVGTGARARVNDRGRVNARGRARTNAGTSSFSTFDAKFLEPLSDTSDVLKSYIEHLVDEVENVRNSCRFCKSRGPPYDLLSVTHTLKYPNGVIACPLLRSHICGICGATGDNAHTKTYCPQKKKKIPPVKPHSG